MKLSYCSSFLVVAASVVSLPGAVVAQNNLSDGKLKFPKVKKTNGNRLEFDLQFKKGAPKSVAWDKLQTRLLGGRLPGPTVRIGAGDTLVINFENKMKGQGRVSSKPLTFNRPDWTNLHFHGAYVSSESPADDTSLEFKQGETFQYQVNFRDDHMGGTHWIHPHRHGSGTFQVGGGAAMALVVEDKPGSVPPEVANAEERIMVVQYFNKKDMDEIADEVIRDKKNQVKKDKVWKLEPKPEVGDEFQLVNGQYQPELEVDVGPWYRLRVIFASWDKAALDLKCPLGCQCNLLAKDGIYINDYPRTLDVYPIPSGGRADIMLRCFNDGDYLVESNLADTQYLFKIKSSGDADDLPSPTPTPDWNFNPPGYQPDLRNSPVSDDCSCPTKMGYGDRMNYFSFDPDLYMHRVPLGSVIERKVDGVDSHPYHQHIYPFQLIELGDLSADEANYYKVGDYHDSYFVGSELSEEVTIRYKPRVNAFKGRMPVHCHRLDHSDKGMLAAEYVFDSDEDGEIPGCRCGPTYPLGNTPKFPQVTDSPLDFKFRGETVSCELWEEGEPREADAASDCKNKQFKVTCREICGTDNKCKDTTLKFLEDGVEYKCSDVETDQEMCKNAKVAVHCSKACKMCTGKNPTSAPVVAPTRAPTYEDDD